MVYRVGVGKCDITGPCVEVGFMGMSNIEQQGKGIHMRLFARSFIIVDERGSRIAIVVADLAQCSQAVKLEVALRLKDDPVLQSAGQPLYFDDNVMITATHTHSGPGGYSNYLAYNASIPGFNEQNFEVIVAGIIGSLRMAHAALAPGRIYLAKGRISNCGGNRSQSAYLNNPSDEVACHPQMIDEDMVLLKFDSETGETLGILNWCALHPTTMGEKNRLISGDHKGVASYRLEKKLPGCVVAFANSNCGDQSPNTKFGLPDGIHDTEHTWEIGTRQYEAALGLYKNAFQEIQGEIAYRQAYVDMSACSIEGTGSITWPAALGYGMLNGSQEDSEGFKTKNWGEGTTTANFKPDIDLRLELIKRIAAPALGVRWPDDDALPLGYEDGHAEKPIVFHVGLGNYKGITLVPQILPLQMFKIGPMVMVGHPGEMTTMAGRRIRKTVQGVFGQKDADTIVIAAYANAYSGYTTTREEYALQQYEGASTLFGPWTQAAYQQEQNKLARLIKNDLPVESTMRPLPIDKGQVFHSPCGKRPVDWPLLGFGFGDVTDNVRPRYNRGEHAQVTFVGGYPNHELRTGGTYLTVERKDENAWNVVYDDHDFCTFFRWETWELYASKITIEWHIPLDQQRGLYRLRYYGAYRTLALQDLKPIAGVSGVFEVK